jgi:hypothetical protein
MHVDSANTVQPYASDLKRIEKAREDVIRRSNEGLHPLTDST